MSDVENLTECLTNVIRKVSNEFEYWDKDEATTVSNKMIEYFRENVKNFAENENQIPNYAEEEDLRSERLNELLEARDSQLLKNVECRRSKPLQCIQHYAEQLQAMINTNRMACKQIEKAAVGNVSSGTQDMLKQAKNKYKRLSSAVDRLHEMEEDVKKMARSTDVDAPCDKIEDGSHSQPTDRPNKELTKHGIESGISEMNVADIESSVNEVVFPDSGYSSTAS